MGLASRYRPRVSAPQNPSSGSTAIQPPTMVPVFLDPDAVAAYGAPSVGDEVSWHLTFVASGDAGPGEDRGLVRLRVMVEDLPDVEPGALRMSDDDVLTEDQRRAAALEETLSEANFAREHHRVLLRAGAAHLYWDAPSEVSGEQHVLGHVLASPDVPPGVPATPCRVRDLLVEERRFTETDGTPTGEPGFDPDTADGYVLVTGIPATYTPVDRSPVRFGTLLVDGATRTLETGIVATVDVLGIV